MKTLTIALIAVAVGNLMIGLDRSFGQGFPQAPGVPGTPGPFMPSLGGAPEPQPTFDIDFPGGTPKQLIEAVQKAAQIPINAIIPETLPIPDAGKIPPLKLRNVTVPQLFEALNRISVKTDLRRSGIGPGYSVGTSSYGFRSTDQRPGTNSIWYFFVEAPAEPPAKDPPPVECRFWQLGPYLEKLKVEDITTAIETGWKMLGINPMPKLSFHKDTQLLIVVGQSGQLAIIDQVLRELTSGAKEPKNATTRRVQAPPPPSE